MKKKQEEEERKIFVSWRWERENLRCIVCWEFQITWMFILIFFFFWRWKFSTYLLLMLLSASMSTKFCCQICANMLKDVHSTQKYFLINFSDKSLDFSPLYTKKFTNNEHVLYLDNSHLFTCVRNLKFKNTSHGNYSLSKKHLLHLKWWKYGADEEEVKLYNSIVDLKIISQLCLWKPFWINDFLMIRIIVLACMHAMFFSYSSSPSSTTSSWCKQHTYAASSIIFHHPHSLVFKL